MAKLNMQSPVILNPRFPVFFLLILLAGLSGCGEKRPGDTAFDVDEALDYCVSQAEKTLKMIPRDSLLPAGEAGMPRRIERDSSQWEYVSIEDWTSGFWPGTLWYLYEYTGKEAWKQEADKFSRYLTPLSERPAQHHDLGFMIYCPFGNGYRLTQDPEYKAIILRTADTLATLYNPNVGTILSWPGMVEKMDWPHNTIVDNMMNLELLFWASNNGGSGLLYDIAENHAITTMNNHFRPDHSTYHVVVYDDETGEKIKGVTHQGYADSSMWARGQAWGIYGFTMTYRETGDPVFLDFAQKIADVYIERLPDDLIPYWDFDAPDIPDEPRDASAAAITASAFLELSTCAAGERGKKYREIAEKVLATLSSDEYRSGERNPAFLMHSTGHKPAGSEVDVSINYADYYYLEALLRLKKLQEGKEIMQVL